MASIRQLLVRNPRAVHTIRSDATVFEAIAKMSDYNIGSLLVIDDGVFQGIITERIYARRIALEGKASRDTLVGEVMETKVVIARPDWKIEQCMALMTRKRVRHLPVFDDEKLIGIVSIGDLVKSIIDEQRGTIEQLEQYIHG